jgi:hypothetical protein
MATIAQRTKPQDQPKRKAAISPDLAEFLHMLSALESEFDARAQIQH